MYKIIIELEGGTGNQIFQIMACYSLAKSFGRKPFYTYESLGFNRELEIESIAELLGVGKINYKYLGKTLILNEYDLNHPALYSNFPETSFLPNKDIVIKGYFQNYRIHCKSALEKLRRFADINSKSIFDSKEKFIAVHIRELHGTTFKTPLKNIDNLNLAYYARSISIIKNLLKDSSHKNIKNVLLFQILLKI